MSQTSQPNEATRSEETSSSWRYDPLRDNESGFSKSLEDLNSAGSIFDANGFIIARIWADVPNAATKGRLIAAAPELLALAKRMLAAWEGSGPGIVLDDIRALIEKAEGRS